MWTHQGIKANLADFGDQRGTIGYKVA